VSLFRLGAFVFLVGCASAPEPPPLRVPLDVPLQLSPYVGPALNISIKEFDPGVVDAVLMPIRHAEVRYMPVVLKGALIEAGGWGAVRVLPADDPSAEVLVAGKIIKSDGVVMSLHVQVKDATGRQWFSNTYTDYAFELYDEKPGIRKDPFDDLYSSVVNDINEARSSLSVADLESVFDTATLRYAASLSRDAFSEYFLRDAAGHLQLIGLPARDDAIFARSERIRESEYGFTDTVDEAYTLFYHEIHQTYAHWRKYSHELVLGNALLGVQERRRRSWTAAKQSFSTYKESKLNEDALRKMTDAFDAEVTPTVTSLEGTMIHLSGTLQSRYQEWRDILQDIYAAERAIAR
jgi:hypothetical protein